MSEHQNPENPAGHAGGKAWYDTWIAKFLVIGLVVSALVAAIDQKKAAETAVKAGSWFKSLLRLAWEKTTDASGALLDWARHEALVWAHVHGWRFIKRTLWLAAIALAVTFIGAATKLGWFAAMGLGTLGAWFFFCGLLALGFATVISAVVESGSGFLKGVLHRLGITSDVGGKEVTDGNLLTKTIRSVFFGLAVALTNGALLIGIAPSLKTMAFGVLITIAAIAIVANGILRKRDFGRGWDILFGLNLALLVILVIAAVTSFWLPDPLGVFQPVADVIVENGGWGFAALLAGTVLVVFILSAFLPEGRSKTALHRLAFLAIAGAVLLAIATAHQSGAFDAEPGSLDEMTTTGSGAIEADPGDLPEYPDFGSTDAVDLDAPDDVEHIPVRPRPRTKVSDTTVPDTKVPQEPEPVSADPGDPFAEVRQNVKDVDDLLADGSW